VRVTRQGGTEINVNEHHVVDDVMVLDRSSKLNANGGLIGATAFRPGVSAIRVSRLCGALLADCVGDRPTSRAEPGLRHHNSWNLRIVAIREDQRARRTVRHGALHHVTVDRRILEIHRHGVSSSLHAALQCGGHDRSSHVDQLAVDPACRAMALSKA
jgi:hypothetical protein